MSKVLYEYKGSRVTSGYGEDLARIVKTTITVRSRKTPDIGMFSVRELPEMTLGGSAMVKPFSSRKIGRSVIRFLDERRKDD